MKEVQFRNVDKLFIKMSINDKFMVVFGFFFIALLTLSFGRYQNSVEQIEKHSIENIEQELSGALMAIELLEKPDQLNVIGFNVSTSKQKSSRTNDKITAVVKVGPEKYVSLSKKIPGQEVALKKDALNSFLLSFIWLLPFGFILYWIATFLTGALWVLWDTTEKISNGDLTSRLGFHPGRDEFGTIGCALDNAMDTLTELVVTVKSNAQTLHTTSSSFESETRQSEEQIEQQYLFIDSVATAMEQMTASSQEVTDLSESSSKHIGQNFESVKKSDKLVQVAIKEIEQLSSYIDQTSDSVSTLHENTTKINDVISTINAISAQTNLLALNAAIEAARAGEQGRGFAVVADEVRTLASRTQNATVDIQSMIENLQSETNNISEITQNTVEQAQKSREIMINIGADVTEISDSSQAVIDMSSKIATSSQEQSAVANNISSELSDIRLKSKTIKDLVAQSSLGVVKLSGASENLGEILARYQTN